LATSDDVPIKPGQKHVFKLPEVARNALKEQIDSGEISAQAVNRLLLRVYALSFGDGTGFRAGGVPFP
jgi:hypothetical protein